MKCHDCPRESLPGESRCKRCKAQARKDSRERAQKRRDERKAQGLCPECGQELPRKGER